LPCRRSWVRVPSSASRKPRKRGFSVSRVATCVPDVSPKSSANSRPARSPRRRASVPVEGEWSRARAAHDPAPGAASLLVRRQRNSRYLRHPSLRGCSASESERFGSLPAASSAIHRTRRSMPRRKRTFACGCAVTNVCFMAARRRAAPGALRGDVGADRVNLKLPVLSRGKDLLTLREPAAWWVAAGLTALET
jgi:hypothetical protein